MIGRRIMRDWFKIAVIVILVVVWIMGVMATDLLAQCPSGCQKQPQVQAPPQYGPQVYRRYYATPVRNALFGKYRIVVPPTQVYIQPRPYYVPGPPVLIQPHGYWAQQPGYIRRGR